MKIEFKKLDSKAVIPVRKHSGDAGADISCLHDIKIEPHSQMLVSTGLAVAIPEDTVLFVVPRSGLAAKKEISITNSPGTIDAGYRGELKVIVRNNSDKEFFASAGERIAQLVLLPCLFPELVEVDELEEASDSRGEGGFGSTDAAINKLSKVKLEDIVKEFNFRLGTSWASIKSEDGIEAAKVKFVDDTVVWLTLTEDKDLQYLSCAFKNVNGSSLYENVTVLLSSTDDAYLVCNFVHSEWRRLKFITASGFDVDETVKLLKAYDSVEMTSKHHNDSGMLQSIKVVFKDGSIGLLCLPVDTSMREAPTHEHEAACTCLLYANQSSYKSGKLYANFNIGPAMLPPYVANQFISECECMKNQ